MIRSGTETIFRAVLYSGCASKRVLFSRVEASSVYSLLVLVRKGGKWKRELPL